MSTSKVPETSSFSSSTFQDLTTNRPLLVRLDNIGVLTGQENYNVWNASMQIVWGAMGVESIVVDGAEPADDATKAERDAYNYLCRQAASIYIQVVSPEILQQIVEMKHPHKMWAHLRAEYYRDTPYALVFQLKNLQNLAHTYDTTVPISKFISQFEIEYLRLTNLAKASTDKYRKKLAEAFEED